MSDREAEVSLVADDRIAVKGCLDVDTVAACRDAGLKLMENLGEIVVDLGDSQVNGSAAIALLIAWQREALKDKKEISFLNAPDNLLQIAQACGVEDIIPFR